MIREQWKKWRQRKWQVRYSFIAALIVIVVGALAYLGYYQIRLYEESVLDLYATQQDAYVQLVLDQINVQGDRSDEEIISEILGSLGTSDQKYWTLSKEQALLFVKNVTETNRYKGFTAGTYYITESAKDFLGNLSMDRVKHQMITMGADSYVASGVVFSYRGATYRICLLTSVGVILDQNAFLSAKISLYIYLIVLLLLLLLAVMILSRMAYRQRSQIRRQQEKILKQNKSIGEMGRSLRFVDAYHTRWNLYTGELLEAFLQKLASRHAYPVTLVRLSFTEPQNRVRFLEQAQLLLDETVLRFEAGEKQIVLVFVQCEQAAALQALERLTAGSKTIEKVACCERDEQELLRVYEEFGPVIRTQEEERNE